MFDPTAGLRGVSYDRERVQTSNISNEPYQIYVNAETKIERNKREKQYLEREVREWQRRVDTGLNRLNLLTGNTQKADTWIEDSSIALSYMNLMAASLEIGSCWCQIHLRTTAAGKDAEEAVREVLSIPDECRIVGILALGIPSAQLEPHTLDEADFKRVHPCISAGF